MKPWETPRTWIGAGVAAAVVLALAGWLLLVGPQFSRAATVRQSADDALTSNSTLTAKIAALREKDRQKAQQRALLTRLVAALPTAADYDGFSVRVQRAAAASKVGISTLTVGKATAVTAAGAAAPGAAVSATPEPAAASATPEPGAPAGTAGVPGTTATPGAGTGALSAVRIDWSVTTTGTLAQQEAFLTALRGLDRATVVTGTALTAQAQGGGSTGSLTSGSTMTTDLSVFVAPQSTAQASALEALLTGTAG